MKKVKSVYKSLKATPLLVLLALTVTAVSCGPSEEAEVSSSEAISVNLQQAALQTVPASYRFSGKVKSDNTVRLSTKVSGKIVQLSVEEGDYVSKGETLVRIKDDNLQAQKTQVEAGLSEARASLANTEKNYERMKALFEKESATQKELDDITTQYEMSKAKVQSLEAKLAEIRDMIDYTDLQAPFNGYVVSKMASEGDLAGPGQPLLSIEKETVMKVVVTVPETQISLFNPKDTVTFDVRAVGKMNIQGVVASINPSGNPASRQFSVEISIPDLSQMQGLKSGMFAEVGLLSSGDQKITVPETAIVERGQLTGIYTLNSNSEAVLRWVRLGDKNNGTVEILSGLAPGESFVASYEGAIREGQKVNVQ
ncbi:efflux RND transporter periplasmic adaptor subunit [Balneolaceae bacterium YR4-1]|uniref:Efflux RND transporter periplasmic adaptor subunit n=1 Tax=Halalkalibaculum roseum TaxID=2709311 RepID=A0A6M1SXF0_9BACT|nr:efflux RND transporter periplasmic adaptor subunit [Halalkalibaculum roseum]NGP75794.1 efflux RND transporter periplasmic adaptor subunit [Halalkalibaculum roseum]